MRGSQAKRLTRGSSNSFTCLENQNRNTAWDYYQSIAFLPVLRSIRSLSLVESIGIAQQSFTVRSELQHRYEIIPYTAALPATAHAPCGQWWQAGSVLGRPLQRRDLRAFWRRGGIPASSLAPGTWAAKFRPARLPLVLPLEFSDF